MTYVEFRAFASHTQTALHHGHAQLGPVDIFTEEQRKLAGEIAEFDRHVVPQIVEASGLKDFLRGAPLEALPLDSQQRMSEVGSSRGELVRRVQTAQASIRRVHETLTKVSPSGDYRSVVRLRLQSFVGQPRVVSDIDHTVSREDFRKGLPSNPLLPGSRELDPLYSHLTPQEIEAVMPAIGALGWVPVMEARPDLFERSGKQVPLREGADELARFVTDRYGDGIDFTSRGFDVSARAIVDRLPTGSHRVDSIRRGSVNSAFKDLSVMNLVGEDPNRPVLYIGDGSSDTRIVDIAGDNLTLVAGVFALRGGSFERELKNRGVPHATFTDLNEVVAFLDDIS